MKAKIKIGWAEESITPDKKIGLAGQFYERISQYVETPITVTAMAVEAGGEQMVICSCDLVSVQDNLLAEVRERLKGKVDFPLEKLIVNATHSHTSFVYDRGNSCAGLGGSAATIFQKFIPSGMIYQPLVDSSDAMSPQEALTFLADRIAKAVKRAWESRDDAVCASGFGRVAIGMCRRVCFTDGTAKMWGDADSAAFTHLEGGNDSGVELLYTFDKDKNLTGVVANVACPAQVLEHRSFVSSDYWGKTKKYLREHFSDKLYVLGLCSAAGDQCPRDLVRWVQPETPINDPNIVREHPRDRRADPSMFDVKGAEKIGRRLSREIIDVYGELEDYFDECELIHCSEKLNLPLRTVSPEEAEIAERAFREFCRENEGKTVDYMDSAMLYVHAGTLNRYEKQYSREVFPIEIHCIRMGDIAFVTNPFELFLDYGNRIRARSLAKQTFIIQLACGGYGYLPTEKAERGGHYSAYVSSGYTGHEGGDLLVRESLEKINGFFKKA